MDPPRRRKRFTEAEDLLICQYVVYAAKGKATAVPFWQRLRASAQYNPGEHTWSSLRSRFREVILPNLAAYPLSREAHDFLSSLVPRDGNNRSLEGRYRPVVEEVVSGTLPALRRCVRYPPRARPLSCVV